MRRGFTHQITWENRGRRKNFNLYFTETYITTYTGEGHTTTRELAYTSV